MPHIRSQIDPDMISKCNDHFC